MYGLNILSSKAYDRERSVIGTVDVSNAGNVILAVGHELDSGGWIKTEHVVLDPLEAKEFAQHILSLV